MWRTRLSIRQRTAENGGQCRLAQKRAEEAPEIEAMSKMKTRAESAHTWPMSASLDVAAPAVVSACHLAYAIALWIADRRDGGVPVIIDALSASTCPASVLTPLRLIPSGELLVAGTAAALALAPRESDGLVQRIALAVHAFLSLGARTASISAAWPKARWLHVPTLAMSAARLRPRHLRAPRLRRLPRLVQLPSLAAVALGIASAG